mmetsp:Transcript_79588/g.140460  ORF Transcript_79588/g.140460 Transcript_79588/m.140460 type:complete len:80 (-) Transcript_79588:194-433(-)
MSMHKPPGIKPAPSPLPKRFRPRPSHATTSLVHVTPTCWVRMTTPSPKSQTSPPGSDPPRAPEPKLPARSALAGLPNQR